MDNVCNGADIGDNSGETFIPTRGDRQPREVFLVGECRQDHVTHQLRTSPSAQHFTSAELMREENIFVTDLEGTIAPVVMGDLRSTHTTAHRPWCRIPAHV